MEITALPPSRVDSDDWRLSVALIGRSDAAVPGLDDHRSLHRIFLAALGLWSVGIIPFFTTVAQTEAVTAAIVATYLCLGILLIVGMYIAGKTARMPGFLLIGVILWTSALGAVSDFYYEMAAVTTVALCTAFVSWFGTKLAPVYAAATILGVFMAGLAQADPGTIDRTGVVALAVAFAVTIVARSSEASRVAHHDREVLLHRLAHESRHDELTGVGNRKLLIEQTHIALASSAVSTIALALVDLDDFKAINDCHGHAVGDQVLQSIATRLQAAVGDTAIVTRVGGDEFAVLFTDDAGDTERLLAVLAEACNHEIAVDGIPITVGASIGVVSTDRADASLKQLLAAADDAMYGKKRASRAGRADLIL